MRTRYWVYSRMMRNMARNRGVKVFPRGRKYREHYNRIFRGRVNSMRAKKGVPKRDGSGHGRRDNEGRGGCDETRRTGKGKR